MACCLGKEQPTVLQVVLVYQYGLYYESPEIEARPSETTFVEFDPSKKSFNINLDNKGK